MHSVDLRAKENEITMAMDSQSGGAGVESSLGGGKSIKDGFLKEN